MKTTLQTSVLAVVSLLAVMSNLHGQNSFTSDASHVATTFSGRSAAVPSPSSGTVPVLGANAPQRRDATVTRNRDGCATPNMYATTVATQSSPCPSAPKAQVFGNGRWVALTSAGKLQCSTDGIEWNSTPLPVESFLRGVTFGNGQFVVVGGSYAGGGSVILTSANGRSWSLHTSPSKEVLHGVTYSGDRFIAVGAGGTILTSKSGRCWQKQNSGTDATLAAVASGNGHCVIGGDDGLMLSSRDTQTWARQPSGTSRYVGKIAFHHERFVATTGDLHLVSNDGSHWQAIDSAPTSVGGLLARTNVTVSKASLAK